MSDALEVRSSENGDALEVLCLASCAGTCCKGNSAGPQHRHMSAFMLAFMSPLAYMLMLVDIGQGGILALWS